MPLSARGPRAEPSMGRPVSRLRQRQWPGNLKLEPAGYRSSRRGHAGHARQRCEEAGAAGSIVGTQHARHRAVMARVLSPCSGRDGRDIWNEADCKPVRACVFESRVKYFESAVRWLLSVSTSEAA
jgi:hypothetical protein